LFSQLGYQSSEDAFSERFAALIADPQADVLVATDDEALLGVATTYRVLVAHESGSWCRLTALVVDETQRGRGVGRELVRAAEALARDAGCARIEATSAIHRTAAHAFYEQLGYACEANHFLKRLL